jgi:hypothetical protein
MERFLWMLLLFNFSYSGLAQETIAGDFLSSENMLENEIASEESSNKDFGEMVKSTLDLMGPEAEDSPFSTPPTSLTSE